MGSKRQIENVFYQTLFVDVDSTLCSIEGIDELARFWGKYDEVKSLTQGAMNGELSFDEVFRRRLKIIRPTGSDLDKLAEIYLESLTPHAKTTIKALKSQGANVYLISAGYDRAILPIARALDLAVRHVFANTLYFENGQYAGFDQRNPLTKQHGKMEVIRELRQSKRLGRVVMVGDSVTDIETKELTDLLIGFGGYVQRSTVEENADVFLTAPSFASLIPLVLGTKKTLELASNEEYKDIIRSGIYQALNFAVFNPGAESLRSGIIKCARTLGLKY